MPATITAVMIAYSTVSRPRSSEMKLFKSFLIGDPSFTDVSLTIAAHNSNRRFGESVEIFDRFAVKLTHYTNKKSLLPQVLLHRADPVCQGENHWVQIDGGSTGHLATVRRGQPGLPKLWSTEARSDSSTTVNPQMCWPSLTIGRPQGSARGGPRPRRPLRGRGVDVLEEDSVLVRLPAGLRTAGEQRPGLPRVARTGPGWHCRRRKTLPTPDIRGAPVLINTRVRLRLENVSGNSASTLKKNEVIRRIRSIQRVVAESRTQASY